jgi:hypothetical protein
MPKRLILPLILLTTVIGPASAQDARGSIRTETQERLAGQQRGSDLVWNLLGLVGLLGLLGVRKDHSEDSYHPAPIE